VKYHAFTIPVVARPTIWQKYFHTKIIENVYAQTGPKKKYIRDVHLSSTKNNPGVFL